MIRSTHRPSEESRWLRVLGTLNEFQARLFVADKALDQGRGGISRMSGLTGMSRTTITKAVNELTSRWKLATAQDERIRAGEQVAEKWKKPTSNYWGNSQGSWNRPQRETR